MNCTSDKFILNKNMSNEFVLTIKQNDSTLPLVITPTDTFNLKMFDLETNTIVNGLSSIVTIHDSNNGQIKLNFSNEVVNTLISERGRKSDRYYLKPTYRIAIDCNTENNGNFIVKIPFVYISE